MGLVVDAVSEVAHFKPEDIDNTPSFGTQVHTQFILGMAKTAGRVKILLDIDRVLSHDELSQAAMIH